MSQHIKRNILLFGLSSIIIGCVVVPFVINWLFAIDAKGLLIAKWEAEHALAYSAGVLSFIGTVVLGYISYEQAKGANKMAELAAVSANEANEISIISRIAEFEGENLQRVRECYEKFYDIYLPQNLMKPVMECMRDDGTIDMLKIQILIDYRNELISTFTKYARALNKDSVYIKKEMKDFLDEILKMYHFSISYIDYYTSLERNHDNTPFDDEKFIEYDKIFLTWATKGSQYIIEKEDRLKAFLYTKMTLEEVRELYDIEK